MAKIERFEDLDVWKEAVSIGVQIYNLTSSGNLAKDFAIKDQLRRAAISISNNIAEGFEYNNNTVFVKFLLYAKGSAEELRSNLFVLREAKVLSTDVCEKLQLTLIAASKNISGFMKYLKEFESKRKLKKQSSIRKL
jgi:four helix bundle protein